VPRTIVRVHRDGRVEVEGEGYRGEACLEDLERLLEELRRLGAEPRAVLVKRKAEAAARRS
jgi:acylphosphatase